MRWLYELLFTRLDYSWKKVFMDHHHHHSHAHGSVGHTHAPDSFGSAFAVGVALNTTIVVAQFVFGYAAILQGLAKSRGCRILK
jgi:hypothetical protein